MKHLHPCPECGALDDDKHAPTCATWAKASREQAQVKALVAESERCDPGDVIKAGVFRVVVKSVTFVDERGDGDVDATGEPIDVAIVVDDAHTLPLTREDAVRMAAQLLNAAARAWGEESRAAEHYLTSVARGLTELMVRELAAQMGITAATANIDEGGPERAPDDVEEHRFRS